MKKVFAVVALLSVIVAATAVMANAFTMAEKVVVSNRLVLVARTPAGGFSAEDRINTINDRLAYILGFEVLAPDNIRLARTRGELGIFVGDRLLTTITPSDARANGTSVGNLGRVWLNNARRALPQARPYANIGIAG